MAKVSDCCGAYSEYVGDIDICPECLEHCGFMTMRKKTMIVEVIKS